MAINKDFRVKNGLVVEEGAIISGLSYPTVDGSSDYVISTDGSGNLTLQPAKALASNVSYDNTDSGLIATSIQAAIDELQDNKADISLLSSNITLFPTTTDSDISGYKLMVNATSNAEYNDTAVDIPTGTITVADQLIASLATTVNIIEGSIDGINITTVGNIDKTAGNSNQGASFYFKVFRRSSDNTEHLIGTSNSTPPIYETDGYEQFFSSALIYNSGATFTTTDRVVIKYYATNHGGGSPEFQFQFGGATPVKSLLPVSVEVVVHKNDAEDILTHTTNFNGVLSSADNTIQKALDTIDNMSIGDVSDVNLSTPATNKQALIWDSATSKFIPGDSFSQTDFDNAIANVSIDDLNDVDITTVAPTSGQALIWDGTNFAPGDVTANFLGLTDTPDSYTGQAGRIVQVNAGATGVEFGDIALGSQSRESFISASGQTVFTLTEVYGSQNSILVYVNGVPQFPGENFTLSGSTLTFTSAPDTGSQVLVYGLTPITNEITPGDGTVTAKKLAASAYTRDIFVGDGTDTTFNLSGDVGSPLAPFVYVGGILQDPVTHYNINVLANPQTITFTEAIPNGTDIAVIYGPVNVTGIPSDQSITFNKLAPSNFKYTVFTGDGSSINYELEQQVALAEQLIVTVAGVPQTPVDTYDVDGYTTLTFATAPAVGAKIVVRYFGTPVAIGTPNDNTVSTTKIINGAVTEAKLDPTYVSDVNTGIQTASDNAVAMAIALG